MSDLIPGLAYATFRDAALRVTTEAEFRQSPFFKEWGDALLQFLVTPSIHPACAAAKAAPPPDRDATSTFRIAHWNIEKGVELDRIVRRLTEDPYLADADALCLNEVDVGMARSGSNADVAAVIANALGCHWTYVPTYLECTKGPEKDALAPGENSRGLHGLAILSRHPILAAESEPLPSCWDYFDFFEKRFGFRQGLYARIDWDGTEILVATTHLEVRNTPGCRARQFSVFLDGLVARQQRWGKIPAILSGDFNTHTFRRGGWSRSIREFGRILATKPAHLDQQLLQPWSREPLFAELEQMGFLYRELSDGAATAESTLGTAEDLEILPGPIRRQVERTFGLGSRVLQMRLDWIATRGFRPLGGRTHPRALLSGESASDHEIISGELVL